MEFQSVLTIYILDFTGHHLFLELVTHFFFTQVSSNSTNPGSRRPFLGSSAM